MRLGRRQPPAIVGWRWCLQDDINATHYRHSLQIADELGARSIAFPAIATGVYGFPPDEAAKIAVSNLRSTPTRIDVIRLVAFDQVALDHLYTALGEG